MAIFDKLTPNTVLLTPNRRLAVYYQKQYQQHQLKQQINCWQSLDILPYTSWLERVWKDYHHQTMQDNSILLSPNQELTVWEEIIAETPENSHLLQMSATAEIAKSAWSLLKQWCVELNESTLKSSEDSNTFWRWAKQFQLRCQKQHWIDQSSLAELIIEKIKLRLIHPPAHMILIGFTEISPLQKKLLTQCENANTVIEYHLQKPKNNTVYKISLSDKETEIKTMARWAKQIYATKTTTDISIACIVPNLEDHREIVNKIFTDVFTEPGYYTTNPLIHPFNISAGKSLASYPILHTAFQLLEMTIKPIALESLSQILRSPFLGDAEKEMLARAEFYNQLRDENNLSISITTLIKKTNHPPLLAQRFKHYLNKINSLRAKLTIPEWANIFIELLTLLGWPGERSVNSEEYQLIQRWMSLLNEYQTYEHILPLINYQTALHYLKRLTATTVFQIQSPETPIQILGILEAAEISFDYVWAMGMDDTAWPPTPKPNPFIPQNIQKTLQLPHATAERELQFCEKITSQLKNSAQYIVFSHALHDDETEIRASALLENIDEMFIDQLDLAHYIEPTKKLFAHQEIEILQDDKGPMVSNTEIIRGGAKLFALQAACPFKAYAELRLQAKLPHDTTLGLRAIDRGNITHNALEIIWGELKNSATLHLKTHDELTVIIQIAIKKALEKNIKPQKNNLHYLTLEQKRLEKLIFNWLILEKQRPEFTVIALEQKQQITIANMTLNVQIDRIDQLANNETLIIDYKTGKNYTPQDWFGEKPDAPQLPLYCLIDKEHTAGIAFAIINTEKLTMKGISKTDFNIKDILAINNSKYSDTINWTEQLTSWAQTLEKLGQQFYHGHAEVAPKDGLSTCEHCNLKPLCRIYENTH